MLLCKTVLHYYYYYKHYLGGREGGSDGTGEEHVK